MHGAGSRGRLGARLYTRAGGPSPHVYTRTAARQPGRLPAHALGRPPPCNTMSYIRAAVDKGAGAVRRPAHPHSDGRGSRPLAWQRRL